MFSLHDFVLKTLRGMVGNYPEFQVREYALNWFAKGVLTEGDLCEVEGWFLPIVAQEANGEGGNCVSTEVNEESEAENGENTPTEAEETV